MLLRPRSSWIRYSSGQATRQPNKYSTLQCNATLGKKVMLNLPFTLKVLVDLGAFLCKQKSKHQRVSESAHTTSVSTALRLVLLLVFALSTRAALSLLRSFQEVSSLSLTFSSIHSLLRLCCPRLSSTSLGQISTSTTVPMERQVPTRSSAC